MTRPRRLVLFPPPLAPSEVPKQAHPHGTSTSRPPAPLYTAARRSFKAAVDEQRASLARHGGKLDYDALMEMEVLHRNITEALRMHPPLVMLMRLAKHPFTVTTSAGKTYTIPKVRTCVRACVCALIA